MKKILFVSAMVCMTAVAFVACSKNDGNGAEQGNGAGKGGCVCTDGKGYFEVDAEELAYWNYSSCAQMAAAERMTCTAR